MLYLGHDAPEHNITSSFLRDYPLWIHAKNLGALYYLINNPGLVYFWHQEDYFTLTSNGYIWTYPGQPLTPKSISVLPEKNDSNYEEILNLNCFGICSDFVLKLKCLT